MALRSQRSTTRALRRGSIVWGWLAVALVVAACGGGKAPDDASAPSVTDASSSTSSVADGSTTTSIAAADPSSSTDPSSSAGPSSSVHPSGSSAPTSSPAPPPPPPKPPERAYPAGGPTDVVFPPEQPSYELINGTAGCQKLLDETDGWPRTTTDQVNGMDLAEGPDTYPLYKSAAYACLGRWADARTWFAEISNPPTFLNNGCVRQALLSWLSALIHESEADPSFAPVFVTSSAPSPCPPTNAAASTPPADGR